MVLVVQVGLNLMKGGSILAKMIETWDPRIPLKDLPYTCEGDSNAACKWINGEFSLEPECQEKIGQVQKTLHSWWKKEGR